VAAECRSFTSSELRQAIIQKTIRVGMKAADVKRSWGEPTRVRRAHPGDDEWEYWNPAGDQIVSIGPDGCVTGRRTARDRVSQGSRLRCCCLIPNTNELSGT